MRYTYFKIRAWKDYFLARNHMIAIKNVVNNNFFSKTEYWKKNYIISNYADYYQWYQSASKKAYDESEDDRNYFRLNMILKSKFDHYFIDYISTFLIK